MQPTSIHSLIYRNYLTSSLVPIFTIEVVLLLLYFGINAYISTQNQATLLAEAKHNIQEIASREASAINKDLRAASDLSLMMQRDHQAFVAGNACHLPNGEPEFGVHANGAFYKTHNNGGASLYYANTTQIGELERRKARCSEMLDPLLKSIVEVSPIVTQAYYNTWDDMNRLYPFMEDAPGQYGAAINMEDFNFYYEADAKHNPERKPVWTSAYLDPAGQGWMVSLIVPIYRGDVLEGVSGLDVTIDSFVNNVLNLHFPWDAGTFMVDDKGTILAMQPAIEAALGLKELGAHVYQDNIKQTVEKPEEFNILQLKDEALRSQMQQLFDSGVRIGNLTIDGVDYLISQEIVSQTGWHMMTLIETSKVLEPIIQLKQLTNRIGYFAIAAMVGFYLLFFVYLLRKSHRLTAQIARPIEQLSLATRGLGADLSARRIEPTSIAEIDDLGANFNTMVAELEVRTNALISAKLAAESANVAKSRFLAVMSHEIRTPLNAILGTAQVLQSAKLGPQEQEVQLAAIMRSGANLLEILNSVLDYANIDTQNLEIKPERFSLCNAMADFIQQVQTKARSKKLKLTLQIDPRLPCAITADAKRLEQVLSNLVNNAIKFTPSGGAVELQVVLQDESEQQLLLQFAISDTGIGISAQQQQQLYLPFRQADDSSTRKYSGTGLGLALSKKLVELMGGNIWVESQLGSGSTFYFTLPLQPQGCSFAEESMPQWQELAIDPEQAAGQEHAEALELDEETRQQLAQALLQLSRALQEFRVDAQDDLAQLRQLLGPDQLQAELDAIAEQLDQYDFEQAQAQLLRLSQRLGIELGS
ncbi:MAG: HAMP domain-containing protein [Gammaproteobacteria bacterium]|nr:HAMP domain-containing protein [Gammaproteobacteria bacterium]